MKILVVNWLDRENPQAGGAETHLHEVFGRLATRGHEVSALVSGWSGCAPRARLDGIDVHRAGRRYTFSLAAPRLYRARLAEEDYDVVVEDLNKVPLFTPYWTGAPVLLLAHHLFGTTAFQAGPFPVAAATWGLERAIPYVYRRLPVIAVSESTRDDLVARGLHHENIDVVPNGIDLARFGEEPGAKSVSPRLVFVGRLKEYKRVDLVIRAVADLAARGIDVQLDVAGDGDQSPRLRALADRLGISERVHFRGFVTDEEKVDLLRRAWIHVLTSPKEGWGISCIEAAACGTPTVASDAPGLRESVVDGQTGALVPHGDVDALTDALERLIRTPEERERLGVQAVRFAAGFSWDVAAEAFEERLHRVVDGAARH